MQRNNGNQYKPSGFTTSPVKDFLSISFHILLTSKKSRLAKYFEMSRFKANVKRITPNMIQYCLTVLSNITCSKKSFMHPKFIE
jgi:hypothetical protein